MLNIVNTQSTMLHTIERPYAVCFQTSENAQDNTAARVTLLNTRRNRKKAKFKKNQLDFARHSALQLAKGRCAVILKRLLTQHPLQFF